MTLSHHQMQELCNPYANLGYGINCEEAEYQVISFGGCCSLETAQS
jgi:hypothetical protein